MQAKASKPPSRTPVWMRIGEVSLSVANVRPWFAYPSVAHLLSLSHCLFSQPPSRAPTWTWTGEVPLLVATVRPWAELREASTSLASSHVDADRGSPTVSGHCPSVSGVKGGFNLPLLYRIKDVRDQFHNNFQISLLVHPLGI
jgi:hypothetical protein